MLNIVLALLACAFPALWVFFRVVMRLKERRDALKVVGLDLPLFTKCWGYPTLFIGYGLDALCNLLHCTLLFWELPKETTVSARVKRHCNTGSGKRKAIAVWFRDVLLKPYDPSGGHD